MRRIDHDREFSPGTRLIRSGVLTVTSTDGEAFLIKVTAQVPPLCYQGTGYAGGYDDGRGPGFHRGTVLEADTYDLSHREDMVLLDGAVVRPWHREAGGLVLVNGEAGQGHFPTVSSGAIQKYRLGL